ncbi:MAG: right-handed parallel beta-helix repeat-containing protein [Candidatus Heimdallarchaeota archaeon]|nr:right-handed parallel beta-helix repeat-containing protein [Candidatus Heimdallarchaeota archaeon]
MISSKTPRGVHTEQTNVEQNYIDHEPIIITSDAGFSVFSGSGTLEEPYVIEKLNITTNEGYGISISQTTKYFVISDCYIDATYAGITIEMVAEGTVAIINNVCTSNENSNGVGIQIAFSNKVGLRDNVCNDNEAFGILLFFSYDLILYRNTCNNNGMNGIVAAYANNSLFSENVCINNGWEGLYLAGSAGSNLVSNIFSNNQEYGIRIEYADNSALVNNTIEENKACGIYVWETDGCLFNYNWFIKNYYSSLYFTSSCENNSVFLNNFIENGFSDNSQAVDKGNNTWHDEVKQIGNYWSDLGKRMTYQIYGEGYSEDLYPLNEPIYFSDKTISNEFNEIRFDYVILLILLPVSYLKKKKLNLRKT